MLRDRNLYAPLPPTSGGRLVPGTRRPRRTGNNIANGWGGGGGRGYGGGRQGDTGFSNTLLRLHKFRNYGGNTKILHSWPIGIIREKKLFLLSVWGLLKVGKVSKAKSCLTAWPGRCRAQINFYKFLQNKLPGLCTDCFNNCRLALLSIRRLGKGIEGCSFPQFCDWFLTHLSTLALRNYGEWMFWFVLKKAFRAGVGMHIRPFTRHRLSVGLDLANFLLKLCCKNYV